MKRESIIAWARRCDRRLVEAGRPGWRLLSRSRQGVTGPATLLLLSTLAIVSCASTSRDSVLLKERAGLDVSTVRLRLQVRALAKPFSAIIESAADTVLEQASTDEERLAGLRLKVNGIPAIQAALFEPDPGAALIETAALLAQTRTFIAEQTRENESPSATETVLAAIDTMRARIDRLWAQIGLAPEHQQRFWTMVESWADEHPISSTFTARETTHALYAELMTVEATGLRAMAGRLEETVLDMAMRVDLYGEYVAKQARWQAELLLEESLARGYPGRALQSLGPVPVAVADLPVDLDVQRELVLAAVRSERALILERVRSERLDTLQWAQLERQAITGTVGQERQILLDALRAEREAVLGALHEERVATMQELDQLVARAMQSAREQVVDHVFLRTAQLLAVVLTLCFVGAWCLIWYARRPR